MEKHVVISAGNSKMGCIKSVNLPPIITCSESACKICGKKCYAKRLMKMRPIVRNSYYNNLDILLNDNEKYWREVNAAVAISTYFRFHVSGDIYDYNYFVKMVEVAKNNQHCNILCFTKKYWIVNLYRKCHRIPKNLHVIFSIWEKVLCDNLYNFPEAHVLYKNGTTTAKDGAKYCSGYCSDCAIENKNCWTLKKGEQIIFKEH